jgi:hypothetical protein
MCTSLGETLSTSVELWHHYPDLSLSYKKQHALAVREELVTD